MLARCGLRGRDPAAVSDATTRARRSTRERYDRRMARFPDRSMLGVLMSRFPRDGRVDWLGVRPAREAPVLPCQALEAVVGKGIVGDRYAGSSGSRGVTLMQAEHIPVVAALVGFDGIDPAVFRRNVVVSGIPLIALKGRRFRIGDALLEGTGPCDPCSKMEAALGEGAYNAMRGHGGLCARVLEGGWIRRGDAVSHVD
jgi:MOSC domain-containing protein YiiM